MPRAERAQKRACGTLIAVTRTDRSGNNFGPSFPSPGLRCPVRRRRVLSCACGGPGIASGARGLDRGPPELARVTIIVPLFRPRPVAAPGRLGCSGRPRGSRAGVPGPGGGVVFGAAQRPSLGDAGIPRPGQGGAVGCGRRGSAGGIPRAATERGEGRAALGVRTCLRSPAVAMHATHIKSRAALALGAPTLTHQAPSVPTLIPGCPGGQHRDSPRIVAGVGVQLGRPPRRVLPEGLLRGAGDDGAVALRPGRAEEGHAFVYARVSAPATHRACVLRHPTRIPSHVACSCRYPDAFLSSGVCLCTAGLPPRRPSPWPGSPPMRGCLCVRRGRGGRWASSGRALLWRRASTWARG